MGTAAADTAAYLQAVQVIIAILPSVPRLLLLLVLLQLMLQILLRMLLRILLRILQGRMQETKQSHLGLAASEYRFVK